jgi:hypothetical protein
MGFNPVLKNTHDHLIGNGYFFSGGKSKDEMRGSVIRVELPGVAQSFPVWKRGFERQNIEQGISIIPRRVGAK